MSSNQHDSPYTTKFIKEKILKQSITTKGYLQVVLSREGKSNWYKVHRLVAQTFIPNPENKPQVNHIDGNKINNNINNLEWCTNSENQIHAFKNNLQVKRYGKYNQNSKIINQYDLNGNFIKTWYSIKDIVDSLNIDYCSIWQCCSNKYSQTHGFIFRYAN